MTNSGADDVRGLDPSLRVSGTIRVPGSKSLAQRALVCAALSSGTTRISGLPDGEDVQAALGVVKSVRAEFVLLAPAAISVSGRPPGPHRGWDPREPLDVGESGTLARLATAALGLCGTAARRYRIEARGTLRSRTSVALFAALRAAGVRFDPDHAAWPVELLPVGPPSVIELREVGSSQEVSALLIALAAYPDELELRVHGPIPSRPYLHMTLATLADDFGVRIERASDSACESFRVHGPLRAPDAPLAIEPDASTAAVVLAAGCLSGGEVLVPGLSLASRQGDVRIVEHLRAFGAQAGADERGLFAHGDVTRGARLDLEGEPDLAPVVAVLAAAAALRHAAASDLTGLRTLPGKESSRLEVLAAGLRAIGLQAEATSDALHIAPGPDRPTRVDLTLDSHGDHRMAFAFALLGLLVAGVRVGRASAVAKSWPRFRSALQHGRD